MYVMTMDGALVMLNQDLKPLTLGCVSGKEQRNG